MSTTIPYIFAKELFAPKIGQSTCKCTIVILGTLCQDLPLMSGWTKHETSK